MSNFAFIFPGQGSQFIGMGKDLADNFSSAKAVFEEVDAALGQDLSGLMWSGSEDELKLTANTQPALMTVSVAAMKALEEAGVADNTIVIFTSDNGPTTNEFAKPYRGTKYVTFEGGHRVPFVFHWPAKIKKGSVIDSNINAMDLLSENERTSALRVSFRALLSIINGHLA